MKFSLPAVLATLLAGNALAYFCFHLAAKIRDSDRPEWNPDARSLAQLFALENQTGKEVHACGVWTLHGFLDPGRTQVLSTSLGDTLRLKSWTHQRSGAPSATGKMSLKLLTRPTAHENNTATPPACEENALRAAGFSETLCGALQPSTAALLFHKKTRGLLFDLTARNYDDLISAGPTNLWHFHAALFPVFVSATVVEDQEPGAPPDWIVLLLKPETWNAIGLQGRQPFVVTGSKLAAYNVQRPEKLQAIADLFSERLIAARQGDEQQITHLAEERGFQVDRVVQPFRDGMLWDLAWDKHLATAVRQNGGCKQSMITRYARLLTQPLEKMQVARDKPALHVCYISRQDRGAGSGKLRNMERDILLRLLQDVGAPLFLAPKFAVHITGSRSTGSSADSDRIYPDTTPLTLATSVQQQMLFVQRECAILLGVHGAGMTHSLAMRPGTSVVELLMRKKGYQYFSNIVALMHDVAYTRFDVDGSGEYGRNEWDLTMSKDALANLTLVVQSALRTSLARQKLHKTLSVTSA